MRSGPTRCRGPSAWWPWLWCPRVVTLTSFAKIAWCSRHCATRWAHRMFPSAAIVGALALALSVYVMAPVAEAIEVRSRREPGAVAGLIEAAREPLRGFLAATMARRRPAARGARRAPSHPAQPMISPYCGPALRSPSEGGVPAGVLRLSSFLVLDLLVGYVLLALGVHGLTPGAVALPFKLCSSSRPMASRW